MQGRIVWHRASLPILLRAVFESTSVFVGSLDCIARAFPSLQIQFDCAVNARAQIRQAQCYHVWRLGNTSNRLITLLDHTCKPGLSLILGLSRYAYRNCLSNTTCKALGILRRHLFVERLEHRIYIEAFVRKADVGDRIYSKALKNKVTLYHIRYIIRIQQK